MLIGIFIYAEGHSYSNLVIIIFNDQRCYFLSKTVNDLNSIFQRVVSQYNLLTYSYKFCHPSSSLNRSPYLDLSSSIRCLIDSTPSACK